MTSIAERFPGHFGCLDSECPRVQRKVSLIVSFIFMKFLTFYEAIVLIGGNGRNCTVPMCPSYGNIFYKNCNRNVTYHKIPSPEPERKNLLLRRIKRDENSLFKIRKYCIKCKLVVVPLSL